MLSGRYRIIEDGKCVKEINNVITDAGYSIIRNYLAGRAANWAGSIAVGALNNESPQSTDTQLEFQTARLPVSLLAVDGNEIIMSAELTEEFEGRIFELGIFPSAINEAASGYDGSLITNFSETWEDGFGTPLDSSYYDGDEDTFGGRVGYRNIIIDDNISYAVYENTIDITGYSDFDSISILYRIDDAGDDRTIRINFYDDQLPTPGVRSADFVCDASSTGYKTTSKLIGVFTETGNFNGQVSKIELENVDILSGNATVYLDSIKIDDLDTNNPNFALVSRALVGSVGGNAYNDYFQKVSGSNLTIEYRMAVL